MSDFDYSKILDEMGLNLQFSWEKLEQDFHEKVRNVRSLYFETESQSIHDSMPKELVEDTDIMTRHHNVVPFRKSTDQDHLSSSRMNIENSVNYQNLLVMVLSLSRELEMNYMKKY